MLDDRSGRCGCAPTLAGGGLALQGGTGGDRCGGIAAFLRRLLRIRNLGFGNQGSSAGRRALQEITTSNRSLLGFRHRAILLDCFIMYHGDVADGGGSDISDSLRRSLGGITA